MDYQTEFINAIKALERVKVLINEYTGTVIFYLTTHIIEYNSTKGEKNFGDAFHKNANYNLHAQIKEFEKHRPFLGNEIWHLYRQLLSFQMRLYVSAEIGYKRGKIYHWKQDNQLLNVLDSKYHNLLFEEEDYNKVGGGPVYNVIRAIETEMTEEINKRLVELNQNSNYSFSDFIIGNHNIMGNENVINNKTSFLTNIKFFYKDHPIFFWLQIIVSLFAIFLTLVQLNWIKL